MIKIDLIYNLAILLALIVLSGFIESRFSRFETKGKIFQGILFGIIAIVGMLYPYHLAKGIIFDGRSVVISLCTLFFGPISGAIASALTVLFRFYLGGAGTFVGTLVVLFSFTIGLIFYRIRRKSSKSISNLHLYLFGLIVNLFMLAFFSLLPIEDEQQIYKILIPTVLGVYPIATLLIGKVLVDQEEKQIYLKKLKDNEKRWKFALEGAGDGIWDWNVKTNEVFFSSRWKSMLGYKDTEIENTLAAWERLLHPEDKERVFKEIEKHFSGGHPGYQSEQRLKCKDGSYKWILDRGKIFEQDSSGKPLRVMGTHTDINSNKLNEENLKRNELLLRIFIENSPAAIAMLDTEMKYIITSKRFLTDYDLGNQNIIGKSHYEVFPEIPERWKEIHKRCLAGAIEKCNDDPFPRKSGKLDYIKWEIHPWFDESNQIGGIILFSEVITNQKEAEEKLVTLNNWMSAIFEGSRDAIIISDVDSKIIMVNEAACELSGYSKQELLEKKVSDLHESDNLKNFQNIHYRLLSGEEILSETKIVQKSGRRVDTEINSKKIVINGIPYIHKSIREITERKQALEVLNKLRTAIDNSKDVIFITDKDGVISFINPQFTAMYGYTAEEIVGKTTPRILKSNLYEKEFYEEFWNELLNKRGVSPNQYLNKCKNGSLIDVEGSADTIIDENGNIIGFLGIQRDITIRKQAEKAIKESEEKYRKIVEHSPDAIIIHDNKKLLYANSSAIMLTGTDSFEKVKDISVMDFVHPDSLESVRKRLSQIMETGEPSDYNEEKFITLDGRIITAEVIGIPIQYNGKRVIQTILRDITARKMAENALIESEEKFNKAFHTSPDAAAINRLKDGIYLDINEVFTRISGYTPEEIIGKSSLEINIWADQSDRERLVAALLKDGRMENLEATYRLKNGNVIFGLMSASIINLNGEQCLLSITRDITERKLMEQAIKESEVKYRTILQTAIDGFWLVDENGNLLEVNDTYCRMSGYKMHELLQMKVSDIEFNEDPDRTSKHIEKIRNNR